MDKTASDSAGPATPLLPSIRQPRYPLYQRIWWGIILYSLKTVFIIAIKLSKLPGLRNTTVDPSVIKVYSCQPGLKNRVFIPQAYITGDALLPLYINMHGGGYAFMEPCIDDEFCWKFSNKHNVLVVSLDYPKAPRHRFPVQLDALVELVNAVLVDPDLPVDKSKVAIGGSSAGGNLALGVCQDESLRGKIGGVVALYTPMDFSVEKEDVVLKEGAPAAVLPKSQMMMLSWGYVGAGQDLRDPRLSPWSVDRGNFPKGICVVGCENDALCAENEAMAERMGDAGTESGGRIGDELSWEQNGVRWEKILGEDHAFDNILAFGDRKKRMRLRGQKMRDDIAEWLIREVYNRKIVEPH